MKSTNTKKIVSSLGLKTPNQMSKIKENKRKIKKGEEEVINHCLLKSFEMLKEFQKTNKLQNPHPNQKSMKSICN